MIPEFHNRGDEWTGVLPSSHEFRPFPARFTTAASALALVGCCCIVAPLVLAATPAFRGNPVDSGVVGAVFAGYNRCTVRASVHPCLAAGLTTGSSGGWLIAAPLVYPIGSDSPTRGPPANTPSGRASTATPSSTASSPTSGRGASRFSTSTRRTGRHSYTTLADARRSSLSLADDVLA